MDEPGQNRRSIKSVQKASELILLLKELDGARISELDDHIDLSRGSIHTYLDTLRREGFVVKSGETYELSLLYLDLGEYAKNQLQIYRHSREPIDKLAEKTGELVRLVVEEHGYGVFLYKADGENAVKSTLRPGERELLHCTAQGKAILANLPRSRVDEIVQRHGLPLRTTKTITDVDELSSELETIRENGVAISDEEITNGLRCVGAPVMAPDGKVLGAIAVCGPKSRINGEWFTEELPKMVEETANTIEVNMDFSKDSSTSVKEI